MLMRTRTIEINFNEVKARLHADIVGMNHEHELRRHWCVVQS